MKRCVIYSNCQADGLALFLPKMGFPYEITVYRNYQLILGEQNPQHLKKDCATADLFIYQPTLPQHDEFSSDFMLSLLPDDCDTLSFAYIYNHGMFPLVEHNDEFRGSEFMSPHYWTYSLQTVLALYDLGDIDFNLWERFLFCLTEQAKRERDCDLKLSKWMMENRDRRLLLAANHPTSLVFIELAEQIMKAVGRAIPFIGGPFAENETGLPCSVPHSNYVTEEFGMGNKPDPEAHTFYRLMLQRAWTIRNRKPHPPITKPNDELFGG